MAIPGLGQGFNINPDAGYGRGNDDTYNRANSFPQSDNDFYTSLSFPSELSTMDIRTSEIRDFMEIEILEVIGQGFEEFFSNTLNEDVTAQSIVNDLGNIRTAGGATGDITERFKKSAQETLNKIGIAQLTTDATRLRDQKLDKITKIWIYEPANINYEYGLKYSETDLSTAKRIGDTVSGIINDGKIPGQILKQGMTNLISSVIEGMAKVGGRNGYDIKSIIGNGDLNIKKYIEYKSRAIPTPLLEYLFEGIQRRKFTFAWKLYPKNEQDVYNVFNIIRQLKKHSHPTRMGDYYLKYPNIFKIRHLFLNNYGEISENFYLGRIKPCVLESISVNYTDSNGYIVFDKEFDVTSMETNNEQSTMNFFGKGKAPVGISIQTTFAELELLLSDDFDIRKPGDNNTFGGGGY